MKIRNQSQLRHYMRKLVESNETQLTPSVVFVKRGSLNGGRPPRAKAQ